MNITNEEQRQQALERLEKLVKAIEAYDNARRHTSYINWYSFKPNKPRGENFFNDK